MHGVGTSSGFGARRQSELKRELGQVALGQVLKRTSHQSYSILQYPSVSFGSEVAAGGEISDGSLHEKPRPRMAGAVCNTSGSVLETLHLSTGYWRYGHRSSDVQLCHTGDGGGMDGMGPWNWCEWNVCDPRY